jgi:chromodomain-helicase-DNA-binding protein 1
VAEVYLNLRSAIAASKVATPTIQTPSSSQSESDDYGVRNRGHGKKKRRRPQEGHDSLIPSHAEVRFSTRRAGKVATYNEDDDDIFEEEADMLTPNYWVSGDAEDLSPGIDVVLNHRLKDGAGKRAHLTS